VSLSKNGCMCTFCCTIVFVIIMMFHIDGMNTKVVANFHILLVLEFHDHRSDSFGYAPGKFIVRFCMLSVQI
jgi:hypothetical protein